jgi:hypothetical protein
MSLHRSTQIRGLNITSVLDLDKVKNDPPIVAISRYPPPGAARKKSTPTPPVTIFSAVFFHPGCSVLNSFFSASPTCCLPSSRRNSRPGPHVGRADSEQTIFPPVLSRAANAAFRVGRRAGSGFLICENIAGNCVSKDVMFVLTQVSTKYGWAKVFTHFASYGSTNKPSSRGTNGSSMSGIINICA